ERLSLTLRDIEIVADDQIAILRLRRQRHPEAGDANFLFQRRIELANPRAMGFAAADEDRRTPIAVTSGAATLLAAEFLARPRNFRTFTSGARGSATLFELPRDDAVEDVGARFDGENLVVELDVATSLGLLAGV